MLDRHGGERLFMPRRVDGAISIIDNEGFNSALIDTFNAFGCPVVNGLLEMPSRLTVPVARVVVDNARVGQLAARHLAESGHRHLAFYRWKDNEVSRLRGGAFEVEAKRLGCRVHQMPLRGLRDATWLREVVDSVPGPLAVFAICDDIAAMLADACHELGILVPEQLAIVGVDNDPGLCISGEPPLTSVDTAPWEHGRQSALVLEQLLRGRPAPAQPVIVAPAGISVRRSSLYVVVGNPQLTSAMNFLREHCGQAGALDLVLDAVGISRSTLYRLFVRHYGRTPAEALLAMRIEYAQRLLSTTGLVIAQVAEQSGLRDAPSLCRIFRRHVGRSPAQYRRESRVGRGR